jgi:hypothetical protein
MPSSSDSRCSPTLLPLLSLLPPLLCSHHSSPSFTPHSTAKLSATLQYDIKPLLTSPLSPLHSCYHLHPPPTTSASASSAPFPFSSSPLTPPRRSPTHTSRRAPRSTPSLLRSTPHRAHSTPLVSSVAPRFILGCSSPKSPTSHTPRSAPPRGFHHLADTSRLLSFSAPSQLLALPPPTLTGSRSYSLPACSSHFLSSRHAPTSLLSVSLHPRPPRSPLQQLAPLARSAHPPLPLCFSPCPAHTAHSFSPSSPSSLPLL